MLAIKRNPSPNDLRRFGWAMLAGFAALGVLTLVIAKGDASLAGRFGTRGQVTCVVLWGVGAVLFLTSLLLPRLARPIYLAWMTVAMRLGIVMATVLLTALYLGLLPVFVLVVRWTDPLRKRRSAGGTYWQTCVRREPTLERMRRLF